MALAAQGRLQPAWSTHTIAIAVNTQRGEVKTLHFSNVFLVVVLIAALVGFAGVAAGALEIAWILFFCFILLFVVSLVVGLIRRKLSSRPISPP